jgi:hypothetical protein
VFDAKAGIQLNKNFVKCPGTATPTPLLQAFLTLHFVAAGQEIVNYEHKLFCRISRGSPSACWSTAFSLPVAERSNISLI